uniref:late competence development ComFB family protein n=1 Tax=Spongiibacter sp. UBA6593 TaxID=1947544 RepID=UPI00257D70F6
VQNFREVLVGEKFSPRTLRSQYERSYLEDLFCLSLNALPAKYVRHALDMRMYMSPEERGELELQVRKAVENASEILRRDRRSENRDD